MITETRKRAGKKEKPGFARKRDDHSILKLTWRSLRDEPVTLSELEPLAGLKQRERRMRPRRAPRVLHKRGAAILQQPITSIDQWAPPQLFLHLARAEIGIPIFKPEFRANLLITTIVGRIFRKQTSELYSSGKKNRKRAARYGMPGGGGGKGD